MTIREELERSLCIGWNSGDLAVYADHLQTLGVVDWDLHAFEQFGDSGAWQSLENTVETLDRIVRGGGRARFRVAWGF